MIRHEDAYVGPLSFFFVTTITEENMTALDVCPRKSRTQEADLGHRELVNLGFHFACPTYLKDDILSKPMSCVRAIGFYRCPPGLSKEVFHKKCESILDSIAALPIARLLLRYELTMGLPVPPGAVLIVGECESHEKLAELVADAQFQKVVTKAKDDFGFHMDSSTFAVDVITKIDRETRPARDDQPSCMPVFQIAVICAPPMQYESRRSSTTVERAHAGSNIRCPGQKSRIVQTKKVKVAQLPPYPP
ncbi:hypothetical protein C8R43DRAFT_1113970 [Mycena crocata]|nr:hypothetical protein C8R43DRAFT_1113970 [Mycena crocata]